jgi:hypothetical protein
MAPICEKNVQIKLTPKNFLLIIFNVVYIEVIYRGSPFIGRGNQIEIPRENN